MGLIVAMLMKYQIRMSTWWWMREELFPTPIALSLSDLKSKKLNIHWRLSGLGSGYTFLHRAFLAAELHAQINLKFINCSRTGKIHFTVRTRKQWNRKTTLYQYLSVFDVDVTKQQVLIDTIVTNIVKWVCFHCTVAVSYAHWTF